MNETFSGAWLPLWILVAPMLLALLDLVRTPKRVRPR